MRVTDLNQIVNQKTEIQNPMIAVTGANGLLGSFITRKLVEKNESFVALKRADSDVSLLSDIAGKIKWLDADVLDPVALYNAFENVTHVIHAAGFISYSPRSAKKIMDVNVIGTRNVVNACLNRGIKRLVHISSVAALGRQKNQHRIDETNQWIDSPFNTVYGKSKYMGELEVFRGQAEGLSSVLINPSVILAPADWHKSSARLFKYVWQKNVFYFDGYLNYVDVRDVADITYTMLTAPFESERFIVNAGNISFEHIFRKIGEQFNCKPPFIKANKTLLQIAARIENIRARITGREPILTRETARLAGTHFLFENDKIKKALQFDFRPIDESIAWCCEYYCSQVSGTKVKIPSPTF